MRKKFLSALLSLVLAASAAGMPQLSASEAERARIGTAPVMETEMEMGIETEQQPPDALRHDIRVAALMEALPQGTDPLAAEILAARGIAIIPGYGAVHARMGRTVSPGSMMGLIFTPDGEVFDMFAPLRNDPILARHPGHGYPDWAPQIGSHDFGYPVDTIDVDVSQLSDFEASSMWLTISSNGYVTVLGMFTIKFNIQTFSEGEEDAFLRAFEEMEGISLDEWMAHNEPSAGGEPVYPDDDAAGIGPLTPGASGTVDYWRFAVVDF